MECFTTRFHILNIENYVFKHIIGGRCDFYRSSFSDQQIKCIENKKQQSTLKYIVLNKKIIY